MIDFDGKSTYFVKTNYGGPRKSNSRSGLAPNLKEVFGYSFLELINAGAKLHFMYPPPGTSKGTIFIATKSLSEFIQMDKLNSKSKNIEAALIEIHILCSIFCLTDIHQDNCGQNKHNSAIINFAIPLQESKYH